MTQKLFTHLGGAVSLAVILTIGAGTSAQEAGQTYKIVVDLDETSIGDLRILDNTLNDGIDGDEISSSVRKVAMGAVAEAWIAMENRIDANGMLTLDDGTQMFLLDEDTIEVQAKGKRFQPGAQITFFKMCNMDRKHCHRAPVQITVIRGDGSRLCSPFPPKKLGVPDELQPICKSPLP